MKTGYGFVEFENIGEFKTWLNKQVVTRTINKLQVHHMYLPSYACWATDDPLRRQYNTKYFHTHENKWGNIAQHFSIFPNGHIVTGRNLNSTPIGIKGWNTGAICIEIYGNFDRGVDTMYVEQAMSVLGVYKLLAEKFSVSISAAGIRPHCWFTAGGTYIGDYSASRSAKSCPGTKFFGGNTRESFNKNFYPMIKAFNTKTMKLEGKVITGLSCKGGIISSGSLNLSEDTEDYNKYKKYVGDRLKELQESLTTLEYYTGKLDGITYGKVLYESVLKFQKDKNLEIDGWVGEKTWEAIESALLDKEAEENSDSKTNPTDRYARYGKYLGDKIKQCQVDLYHLSFLPGEPNGIYTAKTYSAITRFQRANKLKVDGYVGEKTWAAIEKAKTGLPTSYSKYGKYVGKRLMELQEKLTTLGYYFDKIDNSFGPNMYSAVTCFQRDSRLSIDGYVGEKTWAAIEKALLK